MKILFDTNIIIDLLLDREPFSTEAARLLTKVEAEIIDGYLSATTVTTIFYLASKALGAREAISQVRKLLNLFSIASVNRAVLENAVHAKMNDYEDAMLHEAAKLAGIQGIVTRNIKDFQKASLAIYSPRELLGIVALNDG